MRIGLLARAGRARRARTGDAAESTAPGDRPASGPRDRGPRYPRPVPDATLDPAPNAAHADRPIFVIGAPRSGTTLLRMILDSHPAISCGEETHFLRDLEPIVGAQWRMLAPYAVPRDWWLARIRALYTDFQAQVLTRRGKRRWAEKDPTYTRILPFIGELFPDALYVHVVRDGRDVVASFRDRWGWRSAARAANGGWADHVRAARALATGPTADRYHEIRYETMVADPEGTLRPLFAFLGEAWDPVVLRFDEQEHAATERYTRFTAQRRAEGGETGAIYRSRVGAGGRRLDPALRLLLRRSAGDLLRALDRERG